MQSLPSILSLFCNKFNKFNKTGAGLLDSINHMRLNNLVVYLILLHVLISLPDAASYDKCIYNIPLQKKDVSSHPKRFEMTPKQKKCISDF